jgi:hypothetical protein
MHIKNAAALGAAAPAGYAPAQFGVIDLHEHHAGQRLVDGGQHLVQRRSLHQIAREAV